MRTGLVVLLGIVVVGLWFISATLIAAPIDVIQMMIPSNLLHFSHVQLQMFGLVLFILSLLLVMIWALSGKETTATLATVPASSNA